MTRAPLPAEAPVFLLGVGAQKAGTSWLYQYLRRHPQAALGADKEIGVFLSRHAAADWRPARTSRMRSLAADLLAAADRLTEGAEGGAGDLPPAQTEQMLARLETLALHLAPQRFARHFRQILRRHPGARLVGDITPEYACLTGPQHRAIARDIAGLGLRLRVVYLLRDPVARCYSQLRMQDRNARAAGTPRIPDAAARLAEAIHDPWVTRYTRYEQTLPMLERVHGAENVHVALYEEFFCDAGLARLCAFLGIDPHPGDFAQRANASPQDVPPPAAAVAALRAHFAPTYDYCAARFGAGRIARAWRP